MEIKIYKLISSPKQSMFALALSFICLAASAQTTYTFNYTGGQQTMALAAGTYTLETWGADGGDTHCNSNRNIRGFIRQHNCGSYRSRRRRRCGGKQLCK